MDAASIFGMLVLPGIRALSWATLSGDEALRIWDTRSTTCGHKLTTATCNKWDVSFVESLQITGMIELANGNIFTHMDDGSVTFWFKGTQF